MTIRRRLVVHPSTARYPLTPRADYLGDRFDPGKFPNFCPEDEFQFFFRGRRGFQASALREERLRFRRTRHRGHCIRDAFHGRYSRAFKDSSCCYRPASPLFSLTGLVLLTFNSSSTSQLFLARPFFAPLLFPNESSDARDHCANERTFLSWLRLSIYMSVVSVAIIISFHLKSQPTSIEKRIALPVGIVFWLLSVACLVSGFANYVKTVTKYSRRQALVQSGWKTQVVGLLPFNKIKHSLLIFRPRSSLLLLHL